MDRQPITESDFSGTALIRGMVQILKHQLDHARQDVFCIDPDVYQQHVAHASAFAMGKMDALDDEAKEQCKASFQAICKAAKGVMPKAVERLLQAHYMIAAAEADPATPYKALPLMQLSWIVGMAVGQVRDVDVLAEEKKRKEHAAAGSEGAKARLTKFSPFDDWVKANQGKHKGTPMDKARAMVRVIPVEIANATKDPERRIYDLLRGEISYK